MKDSLVPLEESLVQTKASKEVDLTISSHNKDSEYDHNERNLDIKSLSKSVSEIKLSFKKYQKLPSTKLNKAPSIPKNLPEKISINSISLKQTNSLIKYLVSQQNSKIGLKSSKVSVPRHSIGDFLTKDKQSSQNFDVYDEIEDLKIDTRNTKVSLSKLLNEI